MVAKIPHRLELSRFDQLQNILNSTRRNALKLRTVAREARENAILLSMKTKAAQQTIEELYKAFDQIQIQSTEKLLK